MDVWRYFSHPHISYSRIDYFLISKSLLSITVHITIATILVSDRAPVGLSLRLEQLLKLRPTLWRFNSSQLKNEQSVEFNKSGILDYWLNNEGSVSNPAMEWYAFKVVIGGCGIHHCTPPNLTSRLFLN